MFKLKTEPLGVVKQTKKGGFLRDFLVTFPDGSRDKCTVWADNLQVLAGDGPQERSLALKTDFAFIK